MIFDKGTFGLFPAHMLKGLPAYQQVTFAWLCFHANDAGQCFPSLNFLASEAGISKSSLCRALIELERLGYIQRIQRKHNDRNFPTSTLYQITRKETVSNRDNIVSVGDNALSPIETAFVSVGDTNQINSNQMNAEPKKSASLSPPPQPPHFNCPYDEIIKIYTKYCIPTLPECMVLSDTRKKHIRILWQNAFPKLEDWDDYFKKASSSDFLMGKVQSQGREPFRCNIDWLIKQANMIKIMEGNYDNNR